MRLGKDMIGKLVQFASTAGNTWLYFDDMPRASGDAMANVGNMSPMILMEYKNRRAGFKPYYLKFMHPEYGLVFQYFSVRQIREELEEVATP